MSVNKFVMITLGCPKNEVDSEVMVKLLEDHGAIQTMDLKEADTVFVNTCGFIADASQESVDTILELTELKKQDVIQKIYVIGCLSERYQNDMKNEFPDVDGFFGVIPFESVKEALFPESQYKKPDLFYPRKVSTPSHLAYLKISEGCDHPCTFCAIPMIKGSYHSRSIEAIMAEAEALVADGVRELILIAQDTTMYGRDLEEKTDLVQLLKKLVAIHDLKWIRIMYAHPAHVSDELIQMIADEPRICKYLDMPLQHISDNMLSAMRRTPSQKGIEALVQKLRKRIPGLVLRTAFIVGFPGETGKDFESLLHFIKKYKFDRLGAFQFSAEEGTAAALLPDHLSKSVIEERFNALMMIQHGISLELNQKYVGQVVPVMVDGYDPDQKLYYGRTQGDGYEVDQTVWIDEEVNPGDIVQIRMTESSPYDLFGELVEV